MNEEHGQNLIQSLQKIDPVLRFLTKATGETTVPRELILKTLPLAAIEAELKALVEYKILHQYKDRYGFPTEPKELQGSTKRAAQKRLAALKKQLKTKKKTKDPSVPSLKRPLPDSAAFSDSEEEQLKQASSRENQHDDVDPKLGEPVPDEIVLGTEASEAFEALIAVLQLRKAGKTDTDTNIPTLVLPKQVSYAGSTAAHSSEYTNLPNSIRAMIPDALYNALLPSGRKLYSHQARAIQVAMSKSHCSICTGTGSGKSLCFLLPTLTAAYNDNKTSLLLFPTKALAQDQLTKLQALVATDLDLKERIRPATLDGDTPQSARKSIAEHCNIILTNPDTLHASLLPNWKTYRKLFEDGSVAYVVIDEAHVYDGIFGAHVAMIIRRLVRLCGVHPVFISTSATLPFPEQRFRQLVGTNDDLTVLTSADDGSPRAAKHFMVWNPPVLNLDGSPVGSVFFPRPKQLKSNGNVSSGQSTELKEPVSLEGIIPPTGAPVPQFRRRHAADETARLLAKATSNGIRCIAFCKTRNLVEWVFLRTLELLKAGESTKHLMAKVESYRGGYSMAERRKIEERFFRNELIGVVGTNALELGVDVGGIDLTLHCGYPTSYASLLQQAGRAGRGADRLGQPSLAIVICFNSPAEQHMWRKPETLLAKEFSSPHSMPIRGGVIQGHLLCAGEEYPIVADRPASLFLGTNEGSTKSMPTDRELFGSLVFDEAIDELKRSNSLIFEELPDIATVGVSVMSARPRPSFRRAWTRFSIRSIEPINYSVVDVSHPQQAGRMDAIHSENAVMDTLPYSRVFYHAHPGAIITHRGRRYKIVSMSRPPAFLSENFACRCSLALSAFAKPTNARYVTRPLSNLQITVVKQMESVHLNETPSLPDGATMLAGFGEVNIKRCVHGYKKLSLITRQELSRTELALPPLEYNTFGIYVCADSAGLAEELGHRFGEGVHALSHALLAVAPLIAHEIQRDDLECDHSYFAPTQIVLIDERAGGSGCVRRLWESFFEPTNNILEEAIKLLEQCSYCRTDSSYDGGCPGCIQAHNCLKFNMNLSRSAAIVIGKRMLDRIKCTQPYKLNQEKAEMDKPLQSPDITPRRKARQRKLRRAAEVPTNRSFVVGRTSWPTDNENGVGQQEYG